MIQLLLFVPSSDQWWRFCSTSCCWWRHTHVRCLRHSTSYKRSCQDRASSRKPIARVRQVSKTIEIKCIKINKTFDDIDDKGRAWDIRNWYLGWEVVGLLENKNLKFNLHAVLWGTNVPQDYKACCQNFIFVPSILNFLDIVCRWFDYDSVKKYFWNFHPYRHEK